MSTGVVLMRYCHVRLSPFSARNPDRSSGSILSSIHRTRKVNGKFRAARSSSASLSLDLNGFPDYGNQRQNRATNDARRPRPDDDNKRRTACYVGVLRPCRPFDLLLRSPALPVAWTGAFDRATEESLGAARSRSRCEGVGCGEEPAMGA